VAPIQLPGLVYLESALFIFYQEAKTAMEAPPSSLRKPRYVLR
jgi:hypothetical protein